MIIVNCQLLIVNGHLHTDSKERIKLLNFLNAINEKNIVCLNYPMSSWHVAASDVGCSGRGYALRIAQTLV